MKKLIVSVAAVAALVIPSSVAFATPQPDPDANGDLHSNCHTGSKFRGAGGEDAGPGNPKDTSDDSTCVAAPTPAPGPAGVPSAAAAPSAPAAPSRPAAPAAPSRPAAPAAAVVTQPRTAG
jgi:hypothetical protein